MRSRSIIPRRVFIHRLAVWGGLGALLPALRPEREASGANPLAGLGHGVATVSTMTGDPLDRTKAHVFEQLLGTSFLIVPALRAAAPQVVQLTKVTRSQTTTRPGQGAPSVSPSFSLMFQSAQGTALPQDTYQVEQAELGVFPLFLVPIGPKQARVCYQAIFA